VVSVKIIETFSSKNRDSEAEKCSDRLEKKNVPLQKNLEKKNFFWSKIEIFEGANFFFSPI